MIVSNRADVKREILRLLDAEQDTNFQSFVNLWFELGLADVFSVIRAAWAVRAAWFQVEEDGAIYLPPSYLAMMNVMAWGGSKTLDPVAPDQAAPYFARVGPPTAYLIEGLVLTLLPPQTADFKARCSYYSKLEPLNESDNTNLYIDNAASALIYAGASHGALYRQDFNLASTYADVARARVTAINDEAQAAMYGTGIVMMRSR
jgi:hypothetical protein